MTRVRVIVNPSSGREQAAAHVDLLSARLRERFGSVEIVLTKGDGDAERAARAAVEEGCDTVFVAGGDGTLNEALNGIASAGGLDRTKIGILPLGTGNDFATALGIPTDIPDAIDVLLRERVVPVDVGTVNGRSFVNISGGGFIAEVSQAVTPELKTIAGRFAYLLGGAQALLEYEPVRATVSLEPGGERVGLRLYAFAVCNSRLIGGGRPIAPAAFIDDGLLDVCLIEGMTALEFVALGRKVAAGDHVSDPRVRYYQASIALIELDREIPINTDGELLTAIRCEYTVAPRAARFLAGDAPFTSKT